MTYFGEFAWADVHVFAYVEAQWSSDYHFNIVDDVNIAINRYPSTEQINLTMVGYWVRKSMEEDKKSEEYLIAQWWYNFKLQLARSSNKNEYGKITER